MLYTLPPFGTDTEAVERNFTTTVFLIETFMPRLPHIRIAQGRKITFATGTLVIVQRLIDFCAESDEGHGTPCWIWQGHCDRDGYAEMKFRGHKYRACRLAAAVFKPFELPDGMDVDHLCSCRACVNPFHLEVVDPMTNRVVRVRERERERATAAPF